MAAGTRLAGTAWSRRHPGPPPRRPGRSGPGHPPSGTRWGAGDDRPLPLDRRPPTLGVRDARAEVRGERCPGRESRAGGWAGCDRHEDPGHRRSQEGASGLRHRCRGSSPPDRRARGAGMPADPLTPGPSGSSSVGTGGHDDEVGRRDEATAATSRTTAGPACGHGEGTAAAAPDAAAPARGQDRPAGPRSRPVAGVRRRATRGTEKASRARRCSVRPARRVPRRTAPGRRRRCGTRPGAARG